MIVKLCNAADLPADGKLKAFRKDAFEVCVATCEGESYAFQNQCPHQAAPLAAGELDGCIVTCPYHAWKFNVRSALPEVEGDPPLQRYVLQNLKHEVFIQLPG